MKWISPSIVLASLLLSLSAWTGCETHITTDSPPPSRADIRIEPDRKVDVDIDRKPGGGVDVDVDIEKRP